MHVPFSDHHFRRAAFLAALLLACSTAFLKPALAASVASPVIVPKGGVFTSNTVLTLTASAKEIRYTLDGSEPGTNSLLYSTPLTVTNSVLVKVRSISADSQSSETVVEAYTLVDTNVASFTSTLPLVIIDTFGRAIQSSNTEATLHFVNTGTNQHTSVMGPIDFRGQAKIKPRGYTSLRYPKRSLSVETVDAAGASLPVPLLGLPKDEDWILYAPYPDKSLIRDVLAYELSNKLGHYASRTRFVEVFLNDTTNRVSRAHYAGVYVLEEKVKVAPSRVAISKLSAKDNAEPEITGGYIFKKDHLEKAGEPEDAVRTGPSRVRIRVPTGPGGFPATAAGFLPPADDPAFAHTLSIVTNSVNLTNAVGGTNAISPALAVTIVRTNSVAITNIVFVTNAVIVTNLAFATNHPVITNVVVSSTTVVSTNPIVAMHAVSGTNVVATTNQVDANTAVITTTLAITTSATHRTNYVVATNTVAVTNLSVVTNVVVLTNSIVATNVSIASAQVIETNRFLGTNILLVGTGEALSPYVDRLLTTKEGFITGHTNVFFFVEPKAAKITEAQRAWLTNHLNRFEQALHGPDFRNPTNGYAAFIDVDSFIDQHLFVEATKNIDGFRFSAYFTKDRGGKIKMEPVWDWNLSFGNAKGKQGYMAEHWYWPQLSDQWYPWFRRLFEDPDFGQRYVDRWWQWRTNIFSTPNVAARVDALAASLKEPAARNFERWPIMGDVIGPEYFAAKTYGDEIAYLKTWITNRLAWIDAQFPPPPQPTHLSGTPQTNDVLTLSAPAGQIFFTLDGSDPRLPGGGTSSVARVYQAPIALSSNVAVTARTQKDNRWSSATTTKFAKSAAR